MVYVLSCSLGSPFSRVSTRRQTTLSPSTKKTVIRYLNPEHLNHHSSYLKSEFYLEILDSNFWNPNFFWIIQVPDVELGTFPPKSENWTESNRSFHFFGCRFRFWFSGISVFGGGVGFGISQTEAPNNRDQHKYTTHRSLLSSLQSSTVRRMFFSVHVLGHFCF